MEKYCPTTWTQDVIRSDLLPFNSEFTGEKDLYTKEASHDRFRPNYKTASDLNDTQPLNFNYPINSSYRQKSRADGLIRDHVKGKEFFAENISFNNRGYDVNC